MPQIPVYDSPMAARGIEPSGIGVDAYEGMARRIPGYFREAGAGIAEIGNTIEQHDESQDSVDTANNLGAATQTAADKWREARANGTSLDDFMPQWDEAYGAVTDNLRTDTGNKRAQIMVAEARRNFISSAGGQEAADHAQAAHDAMENGAKNAANLSRQDPETVDANARTWALSAAGQAKAAQLTPPETENLLQQGYSHIYGSAADAWVSQYEGNPDATPLQGEAVRQILQRDSFSQYVPEGQYSALMNRLDAAKKTRESGAQQIAEQAFPDVLKQMRENGGVDMNGQGQALINNYVGRDDNETAFHRAEMQRQFDGAKAYGSSSNGVWQMPEPDLQAKFETLNAQVQTASADQIGPLMAQRDAMADAWQQREKEFQRDPAQYVIDRSPTVAGQYAKFQQSPSPQAFDTYARVLSAEQRRLYPGSTPSLVTAEMAGNISQTLARASVTSGGATAAAGTLQQQAQIAGQWWPQVSHELFRAKVLTPSLFVAASMFDKPAGVGVAEDLIRASLMKPEDLAKGAPVGVAASDTRQAANAALAPLAKSLQMAGGGLELTDAYEQALSNLMLLRGTSSSSDATALADKMILGDYSFRGTFRIPNGARVNPDDVEAGAKAVLNDLPNHKIIAPPSFSGLGPQDQLKAYLNNVGRYGTWVTGPSEDGAILLDEQGHAVYEKNASGATVPVQLKWSQLAPLGAQARGIPGKAYKFIAGQK